MNYNKVVLIGNLTRDPSTRILPSGTSVTEFALAVNRRFKKQDGQQGEEVLFVDCVCYGATGEVIQKYLHKGTPLLVEGRLILDRWEDKDGGGPRQKHRVCVERFEFMQGKKEADAEAGAPPRDEPEPTTRGHAQPPAQQSLGYSKSPAPSTSAYAQAQANTQQDDDSDIPF